MSDFTSLLIEWDRAFFELLKNTSIDTIKNYYFSEYLEKSSLGFNAASASTIQEFEEKSSLKLCPDICSFYKVSNGWLLPFFDADLNKIWAIEEIKKISEVDQDFHSWRDSAQDYSDEEYLKENDFTWLRQRDMNSSFALSPMVDCGCVIANPGFIKDGRWEIFLYTPRAECRRFPNFLEYLKFAYAHNLNSLNKMR